MVLHSAAGRATTWSAPTSSALRREVKNQDHDGFIKSSEKGEGDMTSNGVEEVETFQ